MKVKENNSNWIDNEKLIVSWPPAAACTELDIMVTIYLLGVHWYLDTYGLKVKVKSANFMFRIYMYVFMGLHI